MASSTAPRDTPSPEQGTQESIPCMNPAPFPAGWDNSVGIEDVGRLGRASTGTRCSFPFPRCLRPGKPPQGSVFPPQVTSRAGARERPACATPRWPRASRAPCLPTTIPTASTSSANAKEARCSAEEGGSAHRVPDLGWFLPQQERPGLGAEKRQSPRGSLRGAAQGKKGTHTMDGDPPISRKTHQLALFCPFLLS